ncbi:MAG: peptidase T [Flavobacteriaceae bacterium CG_4_8_14_3_um_filter_34_10]|nr:peptidase T [Flavobacteriia bacterium]OIP52724.1 MAG: peptidase T [Flavobacteriaceae bacterium CG2_30_34_30]PIQ19564.1 MAG: peptidase T [Flavobacteriaceae bacterium CG18_big_fil_WC_8_21_14_2_50_34_36]PIX09310.1 MAG: peptidase T [Flavobacteriaceae bacterium CG_4_8_14_3_um_filter_34_10]PIZ07373.1 MAG: peptidase T [Flavobacteriaceae bacterium CG_4_10_14_0_8_um_filter_34_31]PJC07781.1 MAG: peptidase T [Flavobacteriaceae bacterium CG_4_9_14_0_8_um_filter_34_30]
MIDKQHLINRFISYVTIDTESNPKSTTTPSSEKQWNLANKLVEELKTIGMQEISIDQNAYIMATLSSNVNQEVPTIGFISHFDTSPDFTGANVKPQIIEDYDGKDIVLNAVENIVLSPDYFEDLLQYKGQTLITTDGTTLLGADDKAGITEIVTAMEYLIQHPEIKHGKIRIGFTPDEEIGRGAHKFDVEKFGAEWAYTMDGSQIGELEFENFNAAGAVVTIQGKIVHPGYAKGKMINSLYIATDFINSLPRMETPELTEDRQGFFHLTAVSGKVDQTVLEYIIRDHNKDHFEARKEMLQKLVRELNSQLNQELIQIEIKDQYFNMREKIEPVMHIVTIAEEAIKMAGIQPIVKPIRGGTDGSQLSYKGLPCPNIFAGGHNFHGRYEYVPVESMQKAVEVIINIAQLTAQK